MVGQKCHAMLGRVWLQHDIRNDGVGGSNPSCGTNKNKDLFSLLQKSPSPKVRNSYTMARLEKCIEALRVAALSPSTGNEARVIEYRVDEFLRAADDKRLALESLSAAIEAEAAEQPSPGREIALDYVSALLTRLTPENGLD
jgi:hypothetical protein